LDRTLSHYYVCSNTSTSKPRLGRRAKCRELRPRNCVLFPRRHNTVHDNVHNRMQQGNTKNVRQFLDFLHGVPLEPTLLQLYLLLDILCAEAFALPDGGLSTGLSGLAARRESVPMSTRTVLRCLH
jgi:hypothetical protein